MSDITEYKEARARHHDLLTRQVWAGPAANSAGLLAVTNIVANAPSADVALIALTVPLAAFAVGIWFGGRAAAGALTIAASRMAQAVAWDTCDEVIRRQARHKAARSEMPMSLELARIVHGADAENRIQELYAQILARVALSEQRDEATFREGIERQKACTAEIEKAERRMRLWLSLSIGACSLGVLWVIAQPYLGITISG